MPSKLMIIEKNRALKDTWRRYLKANNMAVEDIFIQGKEPTAKIYDLFFSEKPKVKIKFIEAETKVARQLYQKLTFAAAEKGLDAAKQHEAAIQDSRFTKLHDSAKKSVEKEIAKLLAKFLASDTYDKFVESRIDGGMMSDELGMNAVANKSLATAKYFLVMGKKNSAKSYIKDAVKRQAEYMAKQKKVPKKYVPLTEAQALAKLDKVDVGVPQKLAT